LKVVVVSLRLCFGKRGARSEALLACSRGDEEEVKTALLSTRRRKLEGCRREAVLGQLRRKKVSVLPSKRRRKSRSWKVVLEEE
jgi:hypothetical protein